MPRQPRADTRAEPYQIRLSQAERRRIEEAARVNHQPLPDFCRAALLDAAADSLEPDFVVQNRHSGRH